MSDGRRQRGISASVSSTSSTAPEAAAMPSTVPTATAVLGHEADPAGRRRGQRVVAFVFRRRRPNSPNAIPSATAPVVVTRVGPTVSPVKVGPWRPAIARRPASGPQPRPDGWLGPPAGPLGPCDPGVPGPPGSPGPPAPPMPPIPPSAAMIGGSGRGRGREGLGMGVGPGVGSRPGPASDPGVGSATGLGVARGFGGSGVGSRAGPASGSASASASGSAWGSAWGSAAGGGVILIVPAARLASPRFFEAWAEMVTG